LRFIEPDQGDDVFVHHTEILGSGFKTLSEGDRVRFDIGEGKKGPAAQNVEKI
jgi:CspA family cold shock protein